MQTCKIENPDLQITVKQMVDSFGVRYAVIAGLRTESGHERLVIAYPNEESLRDLIAAPSIIAIGLCSRQAAIAGSRASLPTAAPYQRIPETPNGGENTNDQQALIR